MYCCSNFQVLKRTLKTEDVVIIVVVGIYFLQEGNNNDHAKSNSNIPPNNAKNNISFNCTQMLAIKNQDETLVLITRYLNLQK